MASNPSQPGKIITFYSYKGGTGRSMALANIACLLAKRFARTAQRVLMMDWDLEAPGLHRFFSAKSDLPQYDRQPGVMNYFHSLRELLISSPELYTDFSAPEGWRALDQKLPFDDYIIPDVISGVDFVRAGRFDSEYPKLLGSFDWIDFFERYSAIISAFRELLAARFAYTLVDSRTGLTDVSGICTTLLPEKLVGVFTPNRQSLHGLQDLVIQAIEYRRKSEDFRPLSVFPLPSRVENAEKDLREEWRKDYQDRFEGLFQKVHETKQCDLTAYFDAVLLPHVSYYAYGENIAVLQERSDAISLSAAYQRFFERLIDSDCAWEVPYVEEPQVVLSASRASTPTKQYDAFLSYSQGDVEFASVVNSQLRANGVSTFFLPRDLPPGENWAGAISVAMNESKAIVIFVGPTGGPWQDQESLAVLENCAKDTSKRIIPVLLPNAPSSDHLRLPNFLRNVQSVDFRTGPEDRQGLKNLIWALTGERPRLKRTASQLRRSSLVLTAVVLVVFLASGFLGSFFANRALRFGVYSATEALRTVRVVPGQAPSTTDLQKLDNLRRELQILSGYERKGVPLHLRWGLYVGGNIYPAARQAYFDRFSNLMFVETQEKLVNTLRGVKDKPDPTDSYESTYNALKAYEITTSNPEKSTQEFLSPVLYNTWVSGKTGDEQIAALARNQFDFYSRELSISNPYASSVDALAVEHARNYLSNFGGIDRYYLPLKADVSRNVGVASFSRQFPDSADVFTSPHDVEGAFTPDGFTRMQDAIAHNRVVSEGWVLGKVIAEQMDQSTLQQQLTDRYISDFIGEWRTVLQTSSVRIFSTYHDADLKLGRLVSPSSPLLELLWFVSHNTNVQLQQVADSFQPVHTVVPDGPPRQYILSNNQPYIDSLTQLKSQLSLLSNGLASTTRPNMVNAALLASQDARETVSQIAQNFRVDPRFHIESVTQSLLAEPIEHARALIRFSIPGFLEVQSTPEATVIVDGKPWGTIGQDGRLKVQVDPKTTYVLEIQANNSEPWKKTVGPVKANQTLAVTASLVLRPLPAIVSFTAPTEVLQGQTTRIIWKTTNATSVDIDGLGQNLSPNDSKEITVGQSVTYTLIAKGPGGSSAPQTVSVTALRSPSVVSFATSSPKVRAGESVTLTWTTTDAQSVTINGVDAIPAANGSETVRPSQDTTYTLLAIGAGLPSKASVTVAVDKTQAPATPLPDDIGIRNALDRLSAAYATQLVDELTNEWTGINKDQERTIGRLFSNQGLKAISIQFDNCTSPLVTKDSATIVCTETLVWTANKRRESHPSKVAITLKRTSAGWKVNTKLPVP